MKGTIAVHHHRIPCVLGVNPEERVRQQHIFADVKVRSDFSVCAVSENLNDSVDYLKLAALCTEVAQEKPYFLLEALAQEILTRLMTNFNVDWGWVRLKKPSAIPTAKYAVVEIEQYR